ncbi:MAG: 2OG-Fe(II) oxygenase [Gammaproteobacteria bacterium]|nr:2OG-Fe(II) oxygenase [Gammaproteobacteria bacterium]
MTMPFALNPELDHRSAAATLHSEGRVQLHDVLRSDCADALLHCLQHDTPWSLTYYDDKGPGIIEAHNLPKVPAAHMQSLHDQVYQHAQQGFGYLYSLFHHDPNTHSDGHYPPLLKQFFDFLAGDDMLQLIRTLLDNSDVSEVDAQATRFSPGQFLGYHNDLMPGANRRCAYVFNFTRKWRPEWNGYLQFYDHNGNSPAAFKPSFNTLNLFTVPQPHVVTAIPPYATEHRYAVSGWYRGVA